MTSLIPPKYVNVDSKVVYSDLPDPLFRTYTRLVGLAWQDRQHNRTHLPTLSLNDLAVLCHLKPRAMRLHLKALQKEWQLISCMGEPHALRIRILNPVQNFAPPIIADAVVDHAPNRAQQQTPSPAHVQNFAPEQPAVRANLDALAEFGVDISAPEARTVAALEHITPNLIRAWGQELAAYDYVRNLPGLLLYRLSTTHRPPKPEHRGGPRCKEEPGTQLALPAEAVNPPPPPSLPDDVHQDLDTLGWVGPRDEVVTAFQQEPDSVRAWLDYWLRHTHDVNNPAGAFRQALRSGCHPPRPLDPADKQRRYISGPYAHLIQH